jgi:hypothetical protein
MSRCLFVPRIDVLEKPAYSLPAAVDIAVTRSAENTPRRQMAVKCKEALDVHMQILANRFLSCIPASSPIDKT